MSITMSKASLPAFHQFLGSMSGILDKTAAHCAAKKVDPAVLLGSRLYPDMFPLLRQVQIAADFAKGTGARLAGVEVPKYADEEKTIDELKARLAKTADFLRTLDTAAIDASADRDITITIGGNPVSFKGLIYLVNFAMPNFYFHTTTAYAILRHNGVEVGKGDFMGPR